MTKQRTTTRLQTKQVFNVDQTRSCREAPLAMQVPTMICQWDFYSTPFQQAAAVPPVQSLFKRALPSQFFISPTPLPTHPNHNIDEEQHTAQGGAVARIPGTGIQCFPLLP